MNRGRLVEELFQKLGSPPQYQGQCCTYDSSKIFMEGSATVLFLVRKLYQLSSTLAWIQYQMFHYATTLRHVKWPVFYPESSYQIMFLLSSTFSPYNRSNLKMSFSDENCTIAAQICSAF